jgi:hypothetical protein
VKSFERDDMVSHGASMAPNRSWRAFSEKSVQPQVLLQHRYR